MDYQPIVDFIAALWPPIKNVIAAVGGVTVLGTLVDSLVPDEKDGGFMKKAFAIPFLGAFLEYCSRFSPFNFQKK